MINFSKQYIIFYIRSIITEKFQNKREIAVLIYNTCVIAFKIDLKLFDNHS